MEPVDRELQLVARASAGDQDAFRALWATVERRVFGLCLYLTRNHADALDAMQDTQLATWRNLDRFQRRSPFAAWVAAIARNAALDITRRNARRPESAADHLPEPRLAVGGFEDRLAELDVVRTALGTLRPEHREALLLAAAGMSNAQVADTMDVPLETARVWTFRARRELRAALAVADRD